MISMLAALLSMARSAPGEEPETIFVCICTGLTCNEVCNNTYFNYSVIADFKDPLFNKEIRDLRTKSNYTMFYLVNTNSTDFPVFTSESLHSNAGDAYPLSVVGLSETQQYATFSIKDSTSKNLSISTSGIMTTVQFDDATDVLLHDLSVEEEMLIWPSTKVNVKIAKLSFSYTLGFFNSFLSATIGSVDSINNSIIPDTVSPITITQSTKLLHSFDAIFSYHGSYLDVKMMQGGKNIITLKDSAEITIGTSDFNTNSYMSNFVSDGTLANIIPLCKINANYNHTSFEGVWPSGVKILDMSAPTIVIFIDLKSAYCPAEINAKALKILLNQKTSGFKIRPYINEYVEIDVISSLIPSDASHVLVSFGDSESNVVSKYIPKYSFIDISFVSLPLNSEIPINYIIDEKGCNKVTISNPTVQSYEIHRFNIQPKFSYPSIAKLDSYFGTSYTLLELERTLDLIELSLPSEVGFHGLWKSFSVLSLVTQSTKTLLNFSKKASELPFNLCFQEQNSFSCNDPDSFEINEITPLTSIISTIPQGVKNFGIIIAKSLDSLDLSSVPVEGMVLSFYGKAMNQSIKLTFPSILADSYLFDSLNLSFKGKLNSNSAKFSNLFLHSFDGFSFGSTTHLFCSMSEVLMLRSFLVPTLEFTTESTDYNGIIIGSSGWKLVGSPEFEVLSQQTSNLRLSIASISSSVNFTINVLESDGLAQKNYAQTLITFINSVSPSQSIDFASPFWEKKTFTNGITLKSTHQMKVFLSTYSPAVTTQNIEKVMIADSTKLCFGESIKCPKEIGLYIVPSQDALNNYQFFKAKLDLVLVAEVAITIPSKSFTSITMSRYGNIQFMVNLSSASPLSDISFKDLAFGKLPEFSLISATNCNFNSMVIRTKTYEMDNESFDTVSEFEITNGMVVTAEFLSTPKSPIFTMFGSSILTLPTLTFSNITYSIGKILKLDNRVTFKFSQNIPRLVFSTTILNIESDAQSDSVLQAISVSSTNIDFTINLVGSTTYAPIDLSITNDLIISSSFRVHKISCKRVLFTKSSLAATFNSLVCTNIESIDLSDSIVVINNFAPSSPSNFQKVNLSCNDFKIPSTLTVSGSVLLAKSFDQTATNLITSDFLSLSTFSSVSFFDVKLINTINSISMDTAFSCADGQQSVIISCRNTLHLTFDSSKHLVFPKVSNNNLINKLFLTPSSSEANIHIDVPKIAVFANGDVLHFSKSFSLILFHAEISVSVPSVSPASETHIVIHNPSQQAITIEKGIYSSTNPFKYIFSDDSVEKSFIFKDLSFTGRPFLSSINYESGIELAADNTLINELEQDISKMIIIPTKQMSIQHYASQVVVKLNSLLRPDIKIAFSSSTFPSIMHLSETATKRVPNKLELSTNMTESQLDSFFATERTLITGLTNSDCNDWLDVLSLNTTSSAKFNYRALCNLTGSVVSLKIMKAEAKVSPTSSDNSIVAGTNTIDNSTIVIIVVSVVVGVIIIVLVVFLVLKKPWANDKTGKSANKKKKRHHKSKEESVLEDIDDPPPPPAADSFEVPLPMKLPAVPSRVKATDAPGLPTNNSFNMPSQFQRNRPMFDQKQTLTMANSMAPISGQKRRRDFNTAPTVVNEV